MAANSMMTSTDLTVPEESPVKVENSQGMIMEPQAEPKAVLAGDGAGRRRWLWAMGRIRMARMFGASSGGVRPWAWSYHASVWDNSHCHELPRTNRHRRPLDLLNQWASKIFYVAGGDTTLHRSRWS